MIYYLGSVAKIKQGIVLALIFLSDPNALKDCTLSKFWFDLSTASPDQLVGLMTQFEKVKRVRVIGYQERGFLGFKKKSRVLAYTVSSNEMFININNLNRSAESVAATIIHEYTHNADFYFPNYKFGHGSNLPQGKENTYPYFMGNCAYFWLTNGRRLDKASALDPSD